LQSHHIEHARIFVRVGVVAGFIASILMIFPTGDRQGKNVAIYQPATLAAMEGLFQTVEGAPIAILGQPDMEKKRLDNPLIVPQILSLLTYQRWRAEVRGLDAFPEREWPDSIPLLYYSYHIMVGLGTIFVAVMTLSALMLRKGWLFASRSWLWALMLMLPFPYISTTAGWITAEVGRQPWVIHGLMRTSAGVSMNVSAGNALFTLIGFMGMYAMLSILFLFLVGREIGHGPE
jgi:cytochrome d ubiquinol oxidase subunit I